MAESNIGVNLIEILTTGMYKDARTIFREYIQNSCDAIDKAMKAGILAAGEGSIKITLDQNYICIEDNGCGIAAMDFKNTLRNIARSNKSSNSDKGFRGIGRLCGLAYCRELIFTSTAAGENQANSMHFDAKKLRENFYKGLDVSVDTVIKQVTEIESKIVNADSHGFKVELIDVEEKFLTDETTIKNYLSFVAPVPYGKDFSEFSARIHDYAANLGFQIDEYNITVNGAQIFKEYKSPFRINKNTRDEIFDLSFRDFRDGSGKLIGWAWNGLCGFKGQISDNGDRDLRCIRLRKGNIQIGAEQPFGVELFKEAREPYYFMGEIFAADEKLIPNSQRDYFVPNTQRDGFEDDLKLYFNGLWAIVRTASNVNSAKKTIKKYKDALANFKPDSISSNSDYLETRKLNALELEAQRAVKTIGEYIDKAKSKPSDYISRVVFFLTQNKDEITLSSTPPRICIGVKYLSGANIFANREQQRHQEKLCG